MKIAPAAFSLFAITFPIALAQQTQPPRTPEPVIRSTSQEVMLDVVVRDKKGRPVHDLTAGEIEVTDDGVPQKIRGFSLVKGAEIDEKGQAGASAPAGTKAEVRTAADASQPIRLITIAFEGLGTDGRKNARMAVTELLKNETGKNLYFGVFSIDHGLRVLQPYTSDKEAVKTAVMNATAAGYALHSDESERINQELKAIAAQDAAGSAPSGGSTGPPSGSAMGGMAVAQMAQMTLNMIQYSQLMERTQQGRASVFALLALIKEQYRLPGRKTMMYFTEGLSIPPELVDVFRAIIGTANKANVSVYSIDVRGLTTFDGNSGSSAMLRQAASSSRTAVMRPNAAVTPDQAREMDIVEHSTRANTQNSLVELAEETGGFAVLNSNDFRAPIRRVTEDAASYYAISYSPQIDKYDGHLRKISVKLLRPELKVQTRSGYYALPVVEGQYLMPYEVPMLNALSASPLPRNIPYRSSILEYRTKAGAPNSALVVDVPLEGISFKTDTTSYRTHLSVMAILKDATGSIVQKLSRDVPVEGPVADAGAVKVGHFIYTQHMELPAGRYTLETAVLDRETVKIGAKKQAVTVPSNSAVLGLSSLTAVRKVGQQAQRSDPEDPFEVTGGKVTPTLDDTFKAAAGSSVGLYFVVYPQPGATDAPKVNLDFLQDGKLVVRGQPALPPADDMGRIPYVATTPIDSFKPGQYEVVVTAQQAGKSAQQRLILNVE